MPDRSRTAALTGILDSLVLAASLDVAARFVRTYRDRRHGVDPSMQETNEVALERLARLVDGLREIAARLRLYHLLAMDEAPFESTIIRRFEALTLVGRAAGMLRVVHQSLLSVYPAVDAAVVERARRLQKRFEHGNERRLGEVEDVDRLEDFARSLSLQLASRNGS
jgi:hypothetical protein